ncbi:MAG: polyamine aminopropyltransferase [Planctomycetota bacterium]|jgi:spermidine synthase
MLNRAPLFLLYVNVLVIAVCGLIYELLAGTLASYMLGDSVTQFSLVIGTYLSAMGVGAWLSRYIQQHLARAFVEIELALAFLGGFSAPLLFMAFPFVEWFRPLLLGLVFAVGVFVGLELPLLMRILKEHLDFSDLVSKVLAFDYVGALIASILFPLVFVPYLGLVRTSLVFGILNACVGLWSTFLLRPLLRPHHVVSLRLRAAIVLALLVAGFFQAAQMTRFGEESSLGGKIIHTVASPYQRIAVTSKRGGFQLYLNGHLQFNSTDEYRYHEALVHPALLGIDQPKKILVLGGGDGLAVREILRYPSIQRVVLVDLDPAMTDLSKSFPPLVALNRSSLQDPRVEVINQDAFLWINQSSELFDAVIIDFPDPGSFSIGKLYTTHFFRKLKDRISANTLVSIQCTSPLVAPQSYWCIVRTLEAAGFVVKPFHASVPSFGVWGYALASLSDIQIDAKRLAPDGQLRFLNSKNLADLFTLPQDIRPQTPQINRLDNQSLVRYYDEEWYGID